jgi:transposase
MALARGLRSLGYEVDLYEQRQLSKFLRVRRNKTDAGDAFGIAEAGRVGATVSKVYLKSLECQLLQSRLTIRRHLIRQRVAAVNILGRQLEVFGGRLRRGNLPNLRGNVEREIKKVFGRHPNDAIPHLRYLIGCCEDLIEYGQLADRELRRTASENEVCRRFMQIPGVGPLCALTFYATIGDPHRFVRSADIASYLGLTPRLKESGMKSSRGKISKMGPKAARTLLVSSSVAFVRSANKDSSLWKWVRAIEERRGRQKAYVALARKLSIVLLAMWKSGTSYDQRISP